MSAQLNGSDGVMVYRLHYFGGPRDGDVENAIRPYCSMRFAGGMEYRASEEPPDHVRWVDDFTRDIHLHFKGFLAPQKKHKGN